MKYFLSTDSVLKWIEMPSVYKISKDELYELDDNSFKFLKSCISKDGCDTRDKKFIEYCLTEGILTDERRLRRHPPLIKSADPSLRYLELRITDRCNLRCRHCYIGDTLPSIPSRSRPRHAKRGGQWMDNAPQPPLNLRGGEGGVNSPLPLGPWLAEERVGVRGKLLEENSNELSLKQIQKVLQEFEEMQGLRVMITGGEPLLHPEFSEINEMLPGFFIRKILFTNGLLLNKNNLKELNVDEIQISIDGLEKAHDSLRGKGAFKPAMEAVKLSMDCGFDVSISTMLHSKNLYDLDEMEKLFKSMGVKDWTVDIPCIAGRLERNVEFQLSPEQGGRYLRYGFGDGLHGGESGFGCGLHLMAVMADGRVSKCSFYFDNPVGRIEDGLGECWRRIKPIRLEELKCDCKYIESCRGGCRYRAGLLGDPLGKDLYRCSLYGIISKS